MKYTYSNVNITDLGVVAVRITRALGVSPTGLNDSGNVTEVMFSSSLTPEQKSLLDNLMQLANVDMVPTTLNTKFTTGQVEDIKTITGIDMDIFPTATGATIHTRKVLTNAEKNSIKSAWASLLKEI